MSFLGTLPKSRVGGGSTPGTHSARSTRRTARDKCAPNSFETMNVDELKERFPSELNFYIHPPGCDIRLESMETLAMERLRFLRIIEKHASMKKDEAWVSSIKADLTANALSYFIKTDTTESSNPRELLKNTNEARNNSHLFNRAKDYMSHFILRLAYCRTDDLRRWFISQEVDAFRFRCHMQTDSLDSLVKTFNLGFELADPKSIESIRPQLAATMNSTYRKSFVTPANVQVDKYYRVKFTEAFDLVRARKVFLFKGMCYVHVTDLQHLLIFQFKSLLTQNVALTAKILPNLDEDDRLIKMLSELDKRYTGADYTTDGNTDSIQPEQIKPLNARGAFPLCMRAMQSALDKTHHLKYKARLQYGLFLKGIGLSMDDAIRFFRGEFTQSHVDADKFDKEYTYGIRYNYGKEGKKVNWAPWNCMRIINESVGPGENHGCPYRHHDPDSLRQLLVQSGLEGEALNQVMNTAKEGHFQKACAMQFKFASKGGAQELSTPMTEHPNQYYQESVHGGPKGGTTNSSNAARANLKTERVHMYK